MTAALSGFALGLGLIAAIGAQNAFVLRQGLVRAHVFAVCLVCSLSDAVLISAGVAGSAGLVAAVPWLEPAMRYGGAAFLLAYGAKGFWSAFRSSAALEPLGSGRQSLATALLTCLAFTFLNPHVYLDTLVLVGSVSARYDGSRVEFALGAMAASFVFFFALGYGARLLRPVFADPRAWRVLDFSIGVIMWAIAGKLIFGG